MNRWRHDPGPCPICGAPHTGCTADGGPIVVVQLPATVAAAERARVAAAIVQEATEPPPEFNVATYRGKKKSIRRVTGSQSSNGTQSNDEG